MTSVPRPPEAPTLSVVVPFFDAPENLRRCLEGLAASTVPHELVLVDDASRDARAIELARAAPGLYHRLERNSGPAVARNEGARRAGGDVLVFVDSDCVVHPDTLERVRDALGGPDAPGALFGSYDDEPASPGVVSVYRNLLHHFVHHTGPREASTFWAGCGAVRREDFWRVEGFDESYRRPMIEDIELGMRLRAAGVRIHLRPEIQVKHLKRWRFLEMVRVDVTCRAVPWTKLLITRPGTGGDLNLERVQKLCVVLVFLAVMALALAALAGLLGSPLALPALLAAPLCLAPVVWINRRLYGLFLRRRGPLFALAGVGLHLLYYLYGGLGFLWAHLSHRLERPARVPAA